LRNLGSLNRPRSDQRVHPGTPLRKVMAKVSASQRLPLRVFSKSETGLYYHFGAIWPVLDVLLARGACLTNRLVAVGDARKCVTARPLRHDQTGRAGFRRGMRARCGRARSANSSSGARCQILNVALGTRSDEGVKWVDRRADTLSAALLKEQVAGLPGSRQSGRKGWQRRRRRLRCVPPPCLRSRGADIPPRHHGMESTVYLPASCSPSIPAR
jgi:hypothetical protein